MGFFLGVKKHIHESLEGRLKDAIVTFNFHWRAKEVGSKTNLVVFFPCVLNLYIVYVECSLQLLILSFLSFYCR